MRIILAIFALLFMGVAAQAAQDCPPEKSFIECLMADQADNSGDSGAFSADGGSGDGGDSGGGDGGNGDGGNGDGGSGNGDSDGEDD